MRNILIVEDNPEIANLIQLHLADIHCQSTVATDGEAALQLYQQGDYDLVLLDLMLPLLDGLSVCRQLRALNQYLPIIMLTSKSSELDRVLGLEIGADDYLTKPFSLPELLARIKAQLRRLGLNQSAPEMSRCQTALNFPGLEILLQQREVRLDGEVVTLTAKEFDLLAHFAQQPGRVYSRIQLLEQVWGYSYEGYEHTVNSHINRLRAKIERDPMHPRYIHTVWGVGYKFNSEVA